ncbi:glycosyltransferase [Parapedobacter deserti]|uniref:Glycosyltransferase n=1 Tax=Parapedobacter deserti TaxID=1912957 RepID=A0ABV7JDI3_9SPHI
MNPETLLHFVWYGIQLVVGFNLIWPVLLYGIYFVSRKTLSTGQEAVGPRGDYAVIVTAYEQTTMIPAVVDSLLRLDHDQFIIYVVADKCDVSSLRFDDDRVVLLKPEEVLAGNVKSHFFAIDRFLRPHDRLTIIDSDNLVEPTYLKELDRSFNLGYNAVQGVRKAKNMDSIFACLDAARDLYYHFYDGKILFGCGSSATLAGSGMAFTVDLYKECLLGKAVEGAGFDKVLQYEIVKRGERICFNEWAVVFDQKTSHADQLVAQRSRWINTWFKYFTYGFSLVKSGLVKASRNRFLFGTVLLRPPLFVFLILSVLFLVINWIIGSALTSVWLAGIGLFVAGFFLSLYASGADRGIYRALINIPSFMFYQVLALMKSKKANVISVATKHTDYKQENDQ